MLATTFLTWRRRRWRGDEFTQLLVTMTWS